jgi:ABC-type branched-subunit amino acid transport system substrate-binding protein
MQNNGYNGHYFIMPNSIRLGLMPPLTGLVELYGPEITRAARIACEEINERGGVLGRRLELIVEDDGSLPDTAVPAAERLLDEHGCVALIGNLLSNSRIAVAAQVAEPRRVPYLNFSFLKAASPAATSSISPPCPISR